MKEGEDPQKVSSVAQGESDSVGTPATLIKALNHPMRRSILRFLLEKPGPATSSEIRRAVTSYAAPTLVNFHLDILEKAGALVRDVVPGSRGRLYSCTDLVRVDWILTALRLTATEQ